MAAEGDHQWCIVGCDGFDEIGNLMVQPGQSEEMTSYTCGAMP